MKRTMREKGISSKKSQINRGVIESNFMFTNGLYL